MPRAVRPPTRRDLLPMLAAALLPPARPVRAQPAAPSGSVVLTVAGSVGRPNRGSLADFDMAMLEQLPQQRIATGSPWYPGETQFTGPLLADVLATADARGPSLRLTALNDYRVDIPREDVTRYGVVLARLLDGKPMPVREKGPLFVIYPFSRFPELRTAVYYNRCIWQLRRIDVS